VPVTRRADTSRPVSFTVSAWEWVYATNLSHLQIETNKRHGGEAHSTYQQQRSYYLNV
jgi:hypothetical protein